jgi:exopolysaccharide biosynthesis polyprenyl glycosylphosphotransferase
MEHIANGAGTAPQDSSAKFGERPRRLLLCGDVLATIVAGAVAYVVLWLRTGAESSATVVTTVLALLIGISSVALLAWSGQYTRRQRISRLSDTGVLTRDLIIGVAIANLLSYATKGFFTGVTGPSRLAPASFVVLFWLLGIAVRLTVYAYQVRQFALGRGVRRIMVLGSGPEAARVIEFIGQRPWLGIAMVGRLRIDGQEDAGNESPGPVVTPGNEQPELQPLPIARLAANLDGLQRLDQVMRANGAEEIIVAMEPEEEGELVHAVDLLSLVRVPLTIVPSLFEEIVLARTPSMNGIRVLDMSVDTPARLVRAVKRTVDVCISLCALLALVPTGVPIALAIVAVSGRPVFYRQERLGRYGRPFTIHKFRTMVTDAESLLGQLESQDEGDGPHFKMANDPRLTRVGAFLRKWSLDELPQFWNVLTGEMSVVGPRPPLAREVARYDAAQLVRLKGKPGITGLWQVSGRKNLTFDDMVRLDRYYLENWSLRLDLSIIMRTLAAVLTRRGAY